MLHPDASFKVSRAHAADIIAFVEAMAGMMFFTTPYKPKQGINIRFSQRKDRKEGI